MLHFPKGVELIVSRLMGVAAEVTTMGSVAGLPSKAPNESMITVIV